jgi:beta-lactamase class A
VKIISVSLQQWYTDFTRTLFFFMLKTLLLLLLPFLATAQTQPADTLTRYLHGLPPGINVSLALESLTDTTRHFYHRPDARVPSASVIKLPIMIEAMTWVQDGRLNPDEIHILTNSEKAGGSGVLNTYPHRSRITYRDLITLMMTVSDNTATNILIRELGMDNINARMTTLGLAQSRLNREMMDTLAVKQGRQNYVSAREMNQLLRLIYQKKIATPTLCDEMLAILKANEDTTTIPRLLPKTMLVAHKTGTLDYIRGDVGIIYAKKPFLLSVFVEGTTTPDAERIIGELAKLSVAVMEF